MRGDSTTALAPGFRFHPTDEELVSYYLKRKVSGRPFRIDAISDVDVYKCEPWDLPDKSRLKSRDLEWYFFSALDKKYGNGSRTNRATEKGYWKTTGKDRPVRRGPRTVGMKKTLVYHLGRAPRGERSNWVMHEYKLVDEELEKAAPSQDAFVVCRIFRKSGTGPKNGEHYGAPFVEEEWDNDDDLALVPGAAYVDELALADDVFVEVEDLNQELDVAVLPENLPLNAHHSDGSNSVDDSRDLFQNNEEPFMGTVGNYLDSELPGGQKLFDLPIQDDNGAYPVKYEYFVEQTDSVNPEDVNYLLDEPYLDDTANLPEMDVTSDKNEYFIEQSDNMNPVEASYLPDEPYLDATNNILLDDGLFLETNDLSNPVEVDDSGLDILQEYLTCIDAEDGFLNPAALENSITRQSFLNQEGPMNAQTEAGSVASHQPLKPQYNDGASTSEQNQESEGFNSDIKSPLIRKASCMLESISAPSTFASELPSKDVIRRLHSAARSSSPVHVTAGMIQIPDSTVSGLKMKWSFDKNGNLNFILSFVLPQVDMEPAASFQPAKVVSAMPWAAFYIIFVLALLLTVCYKFGTCICTR